MPLVLSLHSPVITRSLARDGGNKSTRTLKLRKCRLARHVLRGYLRPSWFQFCRPDFLGWVIPHYLVAVDIPI
jgi:hypothetical protein